MRRPTRAVNWKLPLSSCRGDHLVLTHAHSARAKKPAAPSPLVEAYELDNVAILADLSPDELEAIRRKCREVGDRAEHFVYRHERQRLQRAGRSDLADKIDWVSRKAVGKGYDIKSFEL